MASEAGGLFTWWHHSVIEGRMVGTDGPHEAKQTAAKHGCQKCVKCSVEQQDEAWTEGGEMITQEIMFDLNQENN